MLIPILLINACIALCFSEDYNEDLLAAHEEEVQKVKDYYHDFQTVLEMVAKRQKLWNEMIEFEVSIESIDIMQNQVFFYRFYKQTYQGMFEIACVCLQIHQKV